MFIYLIGVFFLDQWPKTSSGFRSTSGTTASVAIIKNSKIYIGHVGDSGIALGYDDSGCDKFIRPKGTMLTIVSYTLIFKHLKRSFIMNKSRLIKSFIDLNVST